jgi:hypothetical protein
MSDLTGEISREDGSVRVQQRQQTQHLHLSEMRGEGLGAVEMARDLFLLATRDRDGRGVGMIAVLLCVGV